MLESMKRGTIAQHTLGLLSLVLWLCGCEPKSSDGQRGSAERDTRNESAVRTLGQVRLASAEQRVLDIATAPLVARVRPTGHLALGVVVDLEPLLDARNRILDTDSALKIARSSLRLAEQNYRRLRNLHDQGVTAARELQLAEANRVAESTRLAAAELDHRESREAAYQTWGKALIEELLQKQSPLFNDFISVKRALISLTLPAGTSEAPHTLDVLNPQTGDSIAATLTGRSPRSDTVTQGPTYFYVCQAGELRAGQRVSASSGPVIQKPEGVWVPRSAVVWIDGSAWIYLAEGETDFVRRKLTGEIADGDGWFVAEGLAPGDRVVARGAQSLYGAESRLGGTAQDDD